ncbi:hypothetical protein BGX38DRAFT_891421 [Terfezia claveryi]|nr:hypothetical protein BGX38DRAFT_891421 [Terfezia claveryi]
MRGQRYIARLEREPYVVNLRVGSALSGFRMQLYFRREGEATIPGLEAQGNDLDLAPPEAVVPEFDARPLVPPEAPASLALPAVPLSSLEVAGPPEVAGLPEVARTTEVIGPLEPPEFPTLPELPFPPLEVAEPSEVAEPLDVAIPPEIATSLVSIRPS